MPPQNLALTSIFSCIEFPGKHVIGHFGEKENNKKAKVSFIVYTNLLSSMGVTTEIGFHSGIDTSLNF